MKSRIVFDLDGTLIDSAPDIRNIANAALSTVGAAPISLAETHDFIGEGIGIFVEKMRAARGLADHLQAQLLNDLIARYDDAVTLTVTYPDVTETLRRLSRDHALGICTNKLQSPANAVLRHLGLRDLFGVVTGGDNPRGRKPDPEGLLAAFDDLGTGPRIYVGDSMVDAETARRASVPFFLFTQGYRKEPVSEIPHDVAFDSFGTLPALIETHLSS